MNLHQLRYLVRTADVGTMTGAARSLHVAQPALSRGLRNLEQEMGVRLFAKSGRGVTLTPDGQRVVGLARRVLANLDGLHAFARATRSNCLQVASTPTLESELAQPLLRQLYEREPNVQVGLVPADSPRAVASAVRSGQAELGLTDLPAPDDLGSVPLTINEVVLLCPPGTQLADPLPLAGLDALRLVLPRQGTPRRKEFDAFFALIGVTPTVACETDLRSSWSALALAGIAAGFGYRSEADRLAPHGIVTCSFDPPLRQLIGLIHRREQLSDAARALLAVAREAFPESPALPDGHEPFARLAGAH